jgi:hypothetical protein
MLTRTLPRAGCRSSSWGGSKRKVAPSGWHRHPGTRERSAAITTGPDATTGDCCGLLPPRAFRFEVLPRSRGYYDSKRLEGKSCIQAMLSLARRRLNVLWAMVSDAPPTPRPRRRHLRLDARNDRV